VKIKTTLKGFMKAYSFTVFKEWMGINQLQMTSTKVHMKTMNFQFLQHNRSGVLVLIELILD
jgi:hypothetical protein